MITCREKVNKIFKVEMYRKENREVPVKDFLISLPVKLRSKAVRDIELLEKYGTKLTEPYVKSIKGRENKGLYELRIKFSSDNARIFYFTVKDNRFVLLHGFIKKTMKTPAREIEQAKRYMKDYIRRCENDES